MMRYIALDTVEEHIERVKRRAARGGHSANERTLRGIHSSSLSNLRTALNPVKSGIEIVRIYDNSRSGAPPKLVLITHNGKVTWSAENLPEWLQRTLNETAA
jgi:predicted ABC-type ATPase